ncbi:MAG: zinc ribbon domain-containing protein [Coriobacteriaceae bacterium]|jgi:uncharacterized OB-fold protein|nr:zinc ribbon domain-containing protein [Coriobacteriaceae bacterium]
MFEETEGAVYGYRCTACNELHYPKHQVCRACAGREFEEFPLEGEATLVTWTKLYNLPEGYMKPYLYFGIVAYGNGIRAAGQLEVSSPRLGMKVATTTGLVKEGGKDDVIGLIYR